MEQKLVIDGILSSMNKVIGANRSNRYIGARLKRASTEMVAYYCLAQNLKPFKNKIDLNITFKCKDRRTDKDNIISTTKFILDGLVLAGIIPNDGWSEIGDLNYKFSVDKENPQTIVEMVEVN